MKTAERVVGLRESLKMIKQDKVAYVIMARDTDANIAEEVLNICNDNNIPVKYSRNKRRLGRLSGIECSAAVVAILKNENQDAVMSSDLASNF